MRVKTEEVEIVSGAIRSIIRKHGFEKSVNSINGIWNETFKYDTYGDASLVWVYCIRKWEDDGDAGDRAYQKVKEVTIRRWKEEAETDKWLEFYRKRGLVK